MVLAAGSGSRFGAQKLLLPVAGEPLIRRTVGLALAAEADEVLVVVGSEGDTVKQALKDQPVRIVRNPRYAQGMSSSMQAGIRHVGEAAAGALLILGDQPAADPTAFREVVAAARSTPDRIVLPVYRGEAGHPVYFPSALFSELEMVRGDKGGKEVIERDAARVLRLELDLPMPRDIDTAGDYADLIQRIGAGVPAPPPPPGGPQSLRPR